jgi:DNA-3-methyladenine glycosylase II
VNLTVSLKSRGPTDLLLCNQPVTENAADRVAYLNGVLYRAARIREVPVIIRACSTAVDEIEFGVSAAEDQPLPPREHLIPALRRKFSLDLDLPAFYRFVRGIPELAHLPARQSGLRPILKDSLFESLCLAVIDQQLTVAFAARLKHRLMQTYGRRYTVNGLELWLFPTLDDLARLAPDALRPLQFSRNKSRYVIDLARRFLAEPHWEQLRGTDDQIVDRLCTLRGVGRWTAEYGAMLGLGLADTLPAADIGLMRMVQRTYALPARPTETQVRSIGQCWSPWRGLVTFYLWHQEDTLN